MTDESLYSGLAVKLQETQDLSKSNKHRIDKLEGEMKVINETQISLVKIANSVENMGKSMVDMNKKIDNINEKQDGFSEKIVLLENRSAVETKKKVDSVTEKIIWVIVGGLVVGLLSSILPNIPW